MGERGEIGDEGNVGDKGTHGRKEGMREGGDSLMRDNEDVRDWGDKGCKELRIMETGTGKMWGVYQGGWED